MIKDVLEQLADGQDLTEREAEQLMNSMMKGELTPSQMGAVLMGLKSKGESVEEISGFVKAMRDNAIRINGPEHIVDTCGTGGDGHSTFNISTAAAIVTAAAGIAVAKHGNRSVSSKCGSADVLQELGFRTDMTPQQSEQCLQEHGFAFLFAPIYHPSMKNVAVTRKEMAVRTVFNILGPMSNPADAKRQVVGAFNLETARKMSNVLFNTGSEHALVVHSDDGLDEISIHAPSSIFEIKNGTISEDRLVPADVGFSDGGAMLTGDEASTNAKIISDIFNGQDGPERQIVALNAAAAIYVGGKADSIKDGIDIAMETMTGGAARKKLGDLITFSNALAD